MLPKKNSVSTLQLQSIEANGYYLDRVAHHFGKELGRIGDLIANAPDDAQSKGAVDVDVHIAVNAADRLEWIVAAWQILVVWEQRIDDGRWPSLCEQKGI